MPVYQTAVTNESSEPKASPSSKNESNIQVTRLPTLSTKIFWGDDRFIPSRRGCSFEAAHHLLTSKSVSGNTKENKEIRNITQEVDSLVSANKREAMRVAMENLNIIPGLKQRKILKISQSDMQVLESERNHSFWRCTARKKPLIGSSEKMYIPASAFAFNDTFPHLIDWSNKDIIGVSHRTSLMVFEENGTMLTTLFNKDMTTALRWSNDGNKLACTLLNLMMLELYDFEKKKSLWHVPCCCSNQDNDVNQCTNSCICWSDNDRLVLTGCISRISVFNANTGQMLHYIGDINEKMGHILALSFSPNFRFLLASSRRDKVVRIFTWPDMTPWSNITFRRPIKAVAWHPEQSGLLCIGGGSSNYYSLSLWNVNTAKTLDYMKIEPKGIVENLVWNKLSGELLAHWSYTMRTKRYSVFPVFDNFKKVVDALPYDQEMNPSFLKFNSTHERLIAYHNGVISTWNFFGNERPPKLKGCLPIYDSAKQRQGSIFSNIIR